MTQILNHIRANLVEYLALVVAAGRNLLRRDEPARWERRRKAAEEPRDPTIQFDAGSIGGFVRYWARIDAVGKVIASRPRATIVAWYADPTGPYSASSDGASR
jgi:hypothetical protein